MAYKSPYERKFGKKHPNNPAERKRKAEAAKPKPKPKPKPEKSKESKDDQRNRSGLAITKLAAAAGESIKDWQKTADSEKSKTMDLKDRMRKERNKRIRGG